MSVIGSQLMTLICMTELVASADNNTASMAIFYAFFHVFFVKNKTV
jgi:hypothetical protein